MIVCLKNLSIERSTESNVLYRKFVFALNVSKGKRFLKIKGGIKQLTCVGSFIF